MNKIQKAIVHAYRQGYEVDSVGDVILPFSKKPRKLSVVTGNKRSRRGKYLVFSVKLKISGESKSVKIPVHQFVAYLKFKAFSFHKKMEVRHRNGNAHDNRPSNISLGTRQQNELDKPKAVRKRVAKNASLKRWGKTKTKRSASRRI